MLFLSEVCVEKSLLMLCVLIQCDGYLLASINFYNHKIGVTLGLISMRLLDNIRI